MVIRHCSETICNSVQSAFGALVVLSLLAVLGCDKNPSADSGLSGDGVSVDQSAGAQTTKTSDPMLPFEGDAFSPSLARLKADESFSAKGFAQQDECASCHADIAEEWSDSMHSFASLSNDVYLRSFDSFLAEKGEDNTRFCAGCHDPSMMFDPEVKLSTQTAIPQAHQGISCRSCHGVVEVSPQGNASYTVSTSPLVAPDPDDAKSIEVHRAEVTTKTLNHNALCSSCHRGVLTPQMGHDIVLPGLDELGPWRRSAFNQNPTWRIDTPDVKREDCVSCHMPEVNSHRSHRFAGGHSTFAAMIDSRPQLEAVESQLKGAATLDMFALEKLPASAHKDGHRVVGFDVVIFNERVGHSFPGGAKDLRDTWVEVVVRDKKSDEVIASSGLEHAKTASEDYTYILHARMASGAGDTQMTHDVSHFRTPVYDHTIKPRDAKVARYVFALPEDKLARFDQGFDVSVRLRHRRLTPHILKNACDFAKTEEGQEYKQNTLKYKGKQPDPCITQPIIEIASAQGTLMLQPDAQATQLEVSHSSAWSAESKLPQWRRWYRYGLGLLHHVQENVDEARVAFRHAQDSLGEEKEPEQLASLMIFQGLGMVSARQGRTQEAVDLFAKANPEQGTPLASNAYNKAQAYMRVWKFEEAAEAFEEAARLSNMDDARIMRGWAMALGSKARHGEALNVAQRGLVSEPRDPHLLRSQMLAYQGLDDVSDEVREETLKVYDIYKRDTSAPHIRDECSRQDPVCRAERVPIGVRWLRQ